MTTQLSHMNVMVLKHGCKFIITCNIFSLTRCKKHQYSTDCSNELRKLKAVFSETMKRMPDLVVVLYPTCRGQWSGPVDSCCSADRGAAHVCRTDTGSWTQVGVSLTNRWAPPPVCMSPNVNKSSSQSPLLSQWRPPASTRTKSSI